MSKKEKEAILHQRHIKALVISLILITILHLWTVVFGFCLALAMLKLLMLVIDYLCGNDLDHCSSTEHMSNTEQTLWNIEMLNIVNHKK